MAKRFITSGPGKDKAVKGQGSERRGIRLSNVLPKIK